MSESLYKNPLKYILNSLIGGVGVYSTARLLARRIPSGCEVVLMMEAATLNIHTIFNKYVSLL